MAPGRRRVLYALAVLLGLAPACPQGASLPASTVVIASTSGLRASGQCLGVVVAPLAVVAPTECLEHELHVFSQAYDTRLSVWSTRDVRAEVAVTALAHGVSVHTGGSFSLLRLKRPLQDVPPALLQTTTTSEYTSTTGTHVATLEGFSQTSSRLLERSACAAQLSSLQTNTKWDAADWLCVDAGFAGAPSSSRELTANAKTNSTIGWLSDGFLFSQDSQSGEDILWGLVWTSATRCDADSVGAPTTTPVNTVHAVRGLLAKYVYGHQWVAPPVTSAPMPVKTMSAVIVSPGPNSSHSGSADHEPVVGEPDNGRDSTGSTGGNQDVPPVLVVPSLSPSPSSAPSPSPLPLRARVPSWLGEFYDTAALLTPTNDTGRLDNATTLALFLTPRHLVVPRAWLRGNNLSALQWATSTTGQQFKVIKISSEIEFYRDTPTVLAATRDTQLDLFVVEIELPTPRNGDATNQSETDAVSDDTTELGWGSPTTPILVRAPSQRATYESVVISLADRAFGLELAQPQESPDHRDDTGHTVDDSDGGEMNPEEDDGQIHADFVDGVVRFVGASACGRLASDHDNDDNPELVCANVTLVNSPTPVTEAPPSTMGVLQEGGFFVGFTLASPTGSEASRAFIVLRLAAPVHQTFLEAATGNQVEWATHDAFGDDAERVAAYTPYAATLYAIDSDGAVTRFCPGLLIAPQFVLTMASCLRRAGRFTSVGLTKQWESERLYDVRSDRQVPHPLYETPEDYAVDLAVVELAEPVLDIEPVALNPGYPAWVANATIQEVRTGLAREVWLSDEDGDDEPPLPAALVDCEDVGHGRQLRGTRTWAKPTFHPRGLCVKPGPGTRRSKGPPAAGTALLTTTSFGVLTASGFAVSVGSSRPSDSALAGDPDESNNNDDTEPDSDGPEVSSNPSATMFSVASAKEPPQVHVYLSFADNANFINGHARGVVWGARSSSPPVVSVPSPAPAYVVGLRITQDGPNFCSGTLVASAYVLTAAHCVNDALANFVVVSGGASGPEVLAVVLDTVQIHPSFGSPFQYSNDAAVLELASPASVYGVALDLSTDYSAKTRATMFGFGVRSSADLDRPATVRSVDMPLYTRAQCATTLPNIDSSMLCAGGEKGKDACQGDSGGPLVVHGAQGRDALAGIVSAGYGCGLEGVPGVYARASSLVGFVDAYVVGLRTTAVAPTTTPSMATTSTPSSRSGSASNESRSAVDAGDLESYSSNSSSSSAGHGNGSTLPTPNSNPQSGGATGFTQALLSTPVPADLRGPVRAALMSFLLGDWCSFLEDPASSLAPLVDPANELTLRSRGDASAIVTSLQRHAAKPLYSRKDRFQRGTSVRGLWEGAVVASSAHACT